MLLKKINFLFYGYYLAYLIFVHIICHNIILNKYPIYHGIPEQAYYNELMKEYKKNPKKIPNNIYEKDFKLFINSINLEND
jgi:hypothetical protein